MPTLRLGKPIDQDSIGLFNIIKVTFYSADNLVIFVAFSRQQHDVACLGISQGQFDGSLPVRLDQHRC